MRGYGTYSIILSLFVVLLLILFADYIIGRYNLGYRFLDLVRGDSGWPSLSKFQFLIWTITLIFSYLSIYIYRILNNVYEAIPIPSLNVILLMGISIATPLTSEVLSGIKYAPPQKDEEKESEDEEKLPGTITPEEIAQRKLKVAHDKQTKKFSAMLMQRWSPSLSRFQMFAWTFVSVIVYLSQVIYVICYEADVTKIILPDIDSTLVALMGLSQGAYVGGKFLTTADLKIVDIKPKSGKIGDEVVLIGFDFTERVGMVFLGEKIVSTPNIKEWNSSTIRFKVPDDVEPGPKNVQVKADSRLTNIVTFEVK